MGWICFLLIYMKQPHKKNGLCSIEQLLMEAKTLHNVINNFVKRVKGSLFSSKFCFARLQCLFCDCKVGKVYFCRNLNRKKVKYFYSFTSSKEQQLGPSKKSIDFFFEKRLELATMLHNVFDGSLLIMKYLLSHINYSEHHDGWKTIHEQTEEQFNFHYFLWSMKATAQAWYEVWFGCLEFRFPLQDGFVSCPSVQ